MKRILLVLSLVVAAFYGGRAIWRAMASDETKIGWLMAAEASAFNDASVLYRTPGFATDYRDSTIGVDLQTLRAAVVWAWQNKRDPQDRFTWRLELPEGAGTIAVDDNAATATFPLHLYSGIGTDAQLLWGLQVEATLQRRDGDWRIAGSSHKTTAGAAPKSH